MLQGCPVQAPVSDAPSHFSVSPRYIWTLPTVCQTVRCLDSIWVRCARNVLTLHKFVRTEDYINHKLAEGNLPAMHTRMDLLSAQARNPFSPSSWFSEPALKCNFNPESEICSHFAPISAELAFFFYPFLTFSALVFMPWLGLFSIAKSSILDKRTLGAAWRVS